MGVLFLKYLPGKRIKSIVYPSVSIPSRENLCDAFSADTMGAVISDFTCSVLSPKMDLKYVNPPAAANAVVAKGR